MFSCSLRYFVFVPLFPVQISHVSFFCPNPWGLFSCSLRYFVIVSLFPVQISQVSFFSPHPWVCSLAPYDILSLFPSSQFKLALFPSFLHTPGFVLLLPKIFCLCSPVPSPNWPCFLLFSKPLGLFSCSLRY